MKKKEKEEKRKRKKERASVMPPKIPDHAYNQKTMSEQSLVFYSTQNNKYTPAQNAKNEIIKHMKIMDDTYIPLHVPYIACTMIIVK